jgi:hypothetical protein
LAGRLDRLVRPISAGAGRNGGPRHPWIPSWLWSNQRRLHLETSLTHMMTHQKIVSPEFLLAINYPRDRTKQTPLTAFP